MFHLLDWRWAYEPFGLQGYIPDFLIGETLREVKPALVAADLYPCIKKVAESGWHGPFCAVGAIVPLPGYGGRPGIDWPATDYYRSGLHIESTASEWHDYAGNGGTTLSMGIERVDHSWIHVTGPNHDAINQLWREAGNIVQWHK